MSTAFPNRRGAPRSLRGRAKVIAMPTPRVVRRRRAIKLAMGMLAIALVVAVAARIHLIRTSPLSPEDAAGLSLQEVEILRLVNQKRARVGLEPLKFSARLSVMARGHSYDMAIRHYLAHKSPEGSSPADRIRGVGLSYLKLGENIYMDDFPDLDRFPERAVDGWLKSPEHRAKMLSPDFSETGIGLARSSDGKTYVTQDFLR